MAQASLKIDNLSAAYGKTPVLKGISCELRPGELLGVLGPNGSGKTSLLRCAAGSLSPATGKISYSAGAAKPQRALAMVCAPDERPHGYTVERFALLGRFPWLSWTGFYTANDYKCAREALARAGIAALAQRELQTLSSGQWQLATIARGLCQVWQTERPALLLDEPCANLDLNRSLAIFGVFTDLLAQGWAALAALHDCNLAAMFCDTLLGIKNGEQIFYGPTNEVFTEANLEKLYDCPVGIFRHPDLGIPQLYARPGRPSPANQRGF